MTTHEKTRSKLSDSNNYNTETATANQTVGDQAVLSAAGTFTGSGELNDYPDVMASCYSDVAGTLYFDFSVDKVNWRTFPTNGFTVSAGIHEFHVAVKGPRWFRVRYVNGAADQTVFQLFTYFGEFDKPNAPLNQPLGLDADAILVRPTYPWLDIRRGLVSGISVVKKFGRNSAVGTSYTPVCDGGNYQTPTSAQSLEFVSSATTDALNSTGMHELTVVGLDANWNEQTTIISAHATDGQTAVPISGTWMRVFRAWVSKSGVYATQSTASHVGTITIRTSGGGATWCTIPLDTSFPLGQSFIGAYTIPTGYTGYIFLTDISVETGKTVSVVFFQRDNADDVTSSYNGTMRAQSIITGLGGGSPFNRTGATIPFKVTGPADIGFLSAVTTGAADVAVEFEIFLVNE